MSDRDLIILLLIGVVVGVIANRVAGRGGLGLIGDMIAGALGAFAGVWLLPKIGFHPGTGLIRLSISAALGSVILLGVVRVIRRL